MDFLYEVSGEKRFVSDEKLHQFEFRGRLAETIAWAVPHIAMGDNPAMDLRSDAMEPYEGANSLKFSTLAPDAQLEAIKTLMRKRSRMIEIEQITVIMPGRSLSGGQLLLYLPYFAQENEIEPGFFAADGTPPWGCWVYGGEGDVVTPEESFGDHIYIASWIMPALIDEVAEMVSQTSALRWVDHFEPGF